MPQLPTPDGAKGPERSGSRGDDGPPLVSIMATRTRHVELALAVLTMGLVTLIGLLLVLALFVSRSTGAAVGPGAIGWAVAGLLLGGFLGWTGTARGWRRRRPMMPWALAGAAAWLAMTLWAFGQLS